MSVYLIKSDSYIKIGYSETPQLRVGNMQISSPYKLELIAVIPGDMGLESYLHDRFTDLRVRGEWFEYAGLLKRFVDVCQSVFPVPEYERVIEPAAGAVKWIEFKPGTKRKDGSRLYYPKYRRWLSDNGSKQWCGPVPGMSPMTKEEKDTFIREQRFNT